MTSNNPIRFTLNNNTLVIVKKMTNDKYDFELILCNGNRKTFMWTYGASHSFKDKNGNTDDLLNEAVGKFYSMPH